MNVQHNPAPPEINALPAFCGRLRAHFSRWPKGIVPIDKDDVMRLLEVAESTFKAQAPALPKTAAEIEPPK